MSFIEDKLDYIMILNKFIDYLKNEKKDVIIRSYFIKMMTKKNREDIIELMDMGYKLYAKDYFYVFLYSDNYDKEVISEYKEIKKEIIVNGDI